MTYRHDRDDNTLRMTHQSCQILIEFSVGSLAL